MLDGLIPLQYSQTSPVPSPFHLHFLLVCEECRQSPLCLLGKVLPMSAAVAVSQLAEDNAGHLNGKESCLGVVPSDVQTILQTGL